MSVLKELVLLPVAPVRFTVWVAQQVADEADRRQRTPGARVAQLRGIEEARRRGETDEEEAATLEGEVLESAVTGTETTRSPVIGGREERRER
jgi:hypothetical protein